MGFLVAGFFAAFLEAGFLDFLAAGFLAAGFSAAGYLVDDFWETSLLPTCCKFAVPSFNETVRNV